MNKTLLQKCGQCNEPLRFDEKSIRYENDWFHPECFIIKTKKSKEKSPQKHPLLNLRIVYELDKSKDETPKIVSQHEHECPYCKKPMKFEEKTQRYKNIWFHYDCVKSQLIQETVAEPTKIPTKQKKVSESSKDVVNQFIQKDTEAKRKAIVKLDPVQIILASSMLVFLAIASVFFLGTLSVVAMIFGGGLILYNLFTARGPAYLKLRYGKRGPSVFIAFLFVTPFVLGTIVAYEGYSLWESPVRTILLWALTVTFWSNMMFVPLAVFSKYKENLQPEPTSFPPLTVLVPAFNEEKVIARTIDALIDTDYPHKEIIVIDDGSSDQTLHIAQRYKEKIKILHKENGGKATALNLGMAYAKGEIIVIVDADTIIGRHSLKQIIKGFGAEKNVAAVAGNIKVRNATNWITTCQSLEYITGIQIVRRAFDIFGTITIVPGALGAYKRKILEEAGGYHKDTIVEDFDATIKILKSGLITQGSTSATAYTEAPNTIKDFIKQRQRWYRGNIQVLTRHKDALTNPRFGFLQRIAFPYLLLGMLITPIIGFVSTGNAIAAIIMGDGFYVAQVFFVFIVVHYLMTALALRIDGEDMKLVLHSGYLVLGFKQLVDFLLLKAAIEHVLGRKAKWTSAKRVGI